MVGEDVTINLLNVSALDRLSHRQIIQNASK